MKEHSNRAVSILELLISIVLLSVIVLALASIDLFSRHHVVTSDRRARLQNQMYYVIEHMNKEISKAIGNEQLGTTGSGPSADTNRVVEFTVGGSGLAHRLKVYVDANRNGQREPPQNNPPANVDHWIAYHFYDNGSPANINSILYCDRCRQDNCNQCMDNNWITISNNTIRLIVAKPESGGNLSDNYLEIEVAGCHNPPPPGGVGDTCGNTDNPIVALRTNIKMPSVAVR